MKTAETHLGTKTQHPKWRLALPQHSAHRRRNPRNRVSHALFPGIGCTPAAPRTHPLRASGSPAQIPSEPAQPGTTSRGGGTEGESRLVTPTESPAGKCPGFRRLLPGRGEAGSWGLFSESAPSALFGIVPVRGKTGFSTAFQTSGVSLLLSSLARLHSPRGLSSCVSVHFVKLPAKQVSTLLWQLTTLFPALRPPSLVVQPLSCPAFKPSLIALSNRIPIVF